MGIRTGTGSDRRVRAGWAKLIPPPESLLRHNVIGLQRITCRQPQPVVLWLDPSSAGVMFAATSTAAGRIFRSLDAGASWQRSDAGVNSCINRLDGVAGQSTLYAIGNSIWRSDNGGGTWTNLLEVNIGTSLRVPGTDANTVWAGGETFFFSGYTLLSRNRGSTWTYVWDSEHIGDNQTSDIATHPSMDGLALTGHEGFVLRTLNRGGQFQEVLTAPARFFLACDRANTRRAVAASFSVPAGPLYVRTSSPTPAASEWSTRQPRTVSTDSTGAVIRYASTPVRASPISMFVQAPVNRLQAPSLATSSWAMSTP